MHQALRRNVKGAEGKYLPGSSPTDAPRQVDMRYENMVLTKLVHLSKASWQPEIWYDQEPVSDS